MWRVPDVADRPQPDSSSPGAPSAGHRTDRGGSLLQSPWLLTLAFVVVHARLVHEAITWQNTIFGDVTLYEWWARYGLDTGQWPVLDYDWVYPAGALAPVVAPSLVTDDLLGYEILWTAMIVALMFITYLPSLSLWLPVQTKQLKKIEVEQSHFMKTSPASEQGDENVQP